MATKVFENLLKLVTLIGMIIVVFGYSYSYLLLHLYGGEILSTGSGRYIMNDFLNFGWQNILCNFLGCLWILVHSAVKLLLCHRWLYKL